MGCVGVPIHQYVMPTSTAPVATEPQYSVEDQVMLRKFPPHNPDQLALFDMGPVRPVFSVRMKIWTYGSPRDDFDQAYLETSGNLDFYPWDELKFNNTERYQWFKDCPPDSIEGDRVSFKEIYQNLIESGFVLTDKKVITREIEE